MSVEATICAILVISNNEREAESRIRTLVNQRYPDRRIIILNVVWGKRIADRAAQVRFWESVDDIYAMPDPTAPLC